MSLNSFKFELNIISLDATAFLYNSMKNSGLIANYLSYKKRKNDEMSCVKVNAGIKSA